MNTDLITFGESAAEAGVLAAAERPATIMIVEDDDDLAHLLEYRLRKEGFDTVLAQDGKKACDLLAEVEVDLVLLDLLMPVMDGWEFCRWLRGHRERRLAGLPVIMLTALSAGENRIKGLECGADLYLAKPYSIREVVLNCRRLLGEQRERLRLRAELAALKEKEQGGSEAQRMLFHELRSQFTVIGGLCGLMLKNGDPRRLVRLAKDRGYLEVIRTSVQQVAEMADEVLLLSQLGNADFLLPRGACNLEEIVAELMVIYQAKARMKRVTLSVSSLPTPMVKLHRLALRIILSSLLENALKYCPPDSAVALRVTGGAQELRLEVEDRGVGIPLAEQARIFEPYYRGETVRASHQGSGLGLYSVKRLTEALGGVVTLVSAPGEGSLFGVVFKDCAGVPFAPAAPG